MSTDWEAIARKLMAEEIRRFYEVPLVRAVDEFEQALVEGENVGEKYNQLVHKLNELAEYSQYNARRAGHDALPPDEAVYEVRRSWRT